MSFSHLPTKLAFVDVETTGLYPPGDRIIEIGLVRVEDGVVTKRYKQLVDPESSISSFIAKHTGISQSMLTNAPTFPDIQDDILALLEDCTFVAHNVDFDYQFFRGEFNRVGVDFSAPRFCTAELSRRLYSDYSSHGLSSIIKRFGFNCPARHRALDDATVLWDFYQKVCTDFPPYIIANCLAIR